jgi:hypothetical protein
MTPQPVGVLGEMWADGTHGAKGSAATLFIDRRVKWAANLARAVPGEYLDEEHLRQDTAPDPTGRFPAPEEG